MSPIRLSVVVPRVRVDGEHALRAAPLALERKEAVPRADVEDGPAGEVLGDLKKLQTAPKAPPDVPLGTCFDATQGEWVAPGNRVDTFLKSYAQISASVGTFLFAMTLPILETFIRCL